MHILKIIIKLTLIISIVSLVFSSLFLIIYGKITELTLNNFTSIFIWYSIMYTLWTIFTSLLVLTLISLWRRINKEQVWPYVKMETILLLAVIICTASIILFYHHEY